MHFIHHKCIHTYASKNVNKTNPLRWKEETELKQGIRIKYAIKIEKCGRLYRIYCSKDKHQTLWIYVRRWWKED